MAREVRAAHEALARARTALERAGLVYHELEDEADIQERARELVESNMGRKL